LEDDEEEADPKPDLRPGTEISFLNLTLDRMQLAINVQKKLGLHTENETGQIIIQDLKEYVKINKQGLAEL